MKKKVLIVSLMSVVSFGATLATVFTNKDVLKKPLSSLGDTSYTLILDANSLAGANGSGSAVVQSLSGAQIQFDYTGLSIADGKLVFENGATLSNPRLETGNNNYISGVQLVDFAFDGEDTGSFTLDYTWGDSLLGDAPYYQRRGYVVSKSFNSYGFLDERPNFLKFSATAASTVESLTITYSCSRDAVEPGDNLVLSTASQFERFKTVVGRGNNFAGQTVELGADIDMSEQATQPISTFKGTFDGKNHTVSNLVLSGSTQVAPFNNVVDGVIKNVKFENITATSSGQRAAGVAGRAERSTIENAHVLSGSITSTRQTGGIVGVAVNGVKIIDCSNAASVSGTDSSGNNGGILGYNFSGESQIISCVNNGDVSSPAASPTGGLLGGNASAAGITVDILLSEVGKDVSITANGVEATEARAQCGYVVGLPTSAYVTVSGSGKITDEISSVSDWNKLISDSAADPCYRFKVAKLTSDIDFAGSGQTFTKFAGLISGNGHKISNFTLSGASQIALINNCYYGGIKDLKMENVNITCTTQRGAAVVGRSEGAAFKNVEVLSGSITGKAQDGGIVGAVVITKSTFLDCINRANVTNTNGVLGGIVGLSTNTNAFVKMSGCENYGNITSESGFIGGLVGKITDVSGTNLLSIKNSVNHGTIESTGASKNYVAGVLGNVEVVKSTGETSISISKCENRGAVISKYNYTAGIIGGYSTVPTNEGCKINLTIADTDNYGDVTSGNVIGCGGIIASTEDAVASYLLLTIRNCDNHGTIHGYQYAGGIAGLIRNTDNTNESIIDGCNNFGRVIATNGNSSCGIVGEARISVTNCGCYSEAILTPKSGSTQAAKTRSETGACGYITYTYTSGCKTHSGNRLINLDGSNYVA